MLVVRNLRESATGRHGPKRVYFQPFLANFREPCLERLSGKSRRHERATSRGAEKLLFQPFWPPNTGKVHCRNGTPNTFQTVSLRGVLGTSPPGVPWDTSPRPRCIVAGGRPVQGRMRWEEDLPPGYRMRDDADLLVVLRADGSEVVAFSALGADPLEVIATAWEDHE